MKIYEVISTNLDIKDGNFINELFSNREKAYNVCLEHANCNRNKDIVEDKLGILDIFEEKDLKYSSSFGKPAVYYRSHYGNYRMVCYVKTRIVNLDLKN